MNRNETGTKHSPVKSIMGAHVGPVTPGVTVLVPGPGASYTRVQVSVGPKVYGLQLRTHRLSQANLSHPEGFGSSCLLQPEASLFPSWDVKAAGWVTGPENKATV